MKYLCLLIVSVSMIACTNSAGPVAQNTNVAVNTARSERPQTAIAHSSEGQQQPPSSGAAAGKSRWTQGGEPIDTSKLDQTIASAEKAHSAKPTDAAAKKALAAAYLARAMALTDARQYASALGDYRKTVKFDPENAEAKDWIKQITTIYASIGRESPNEGEEPPALPFKKDQ
jgi:tetratricopeptide (TPR) repeat protein